MRHWPARRQIEAIAALLVYLATMVDYGSQLVLGERGVVLCLARTQEQSQVVLEYVAGIIEAAPILAKMVIRRAADSLTLFNRGATIVIAVRAASFRSVRGLTCVAAVADEIAFWQGEDGSANPDVEILRAVRPTLLTTHGPLIAISSPYARGACCGPPSSGTMAPKAIRSSWSPTPLPVR